MMFYKFFCIFNRKAKISKKLIFDKPEVPMTVYPCTLFVLVGLTRPKADREKKLKPLKKPGFKSQQTCSEQLTIKMLKKPSLTLAF